MYHVTMSTMSDAVPLSSQYGLGFEWWGCVLQCVMLQWGSGVQQVVVLTCTHWLHEHIEAQILRYDEHSVRAFGWQQQVSVCSQATQKYQEELQKDLFSLPGSPWVSQQSTHFSTFCYFPFCSSLPLSVCCSLPLNLYRFQFFRTLNDIL